MAHTVPLTAGTRVISNLYISNSSIYQSEIAVPLTGHTCRSETGHMGRYSALVGKRVEAHYRTGDIHLSAVGVLVSDTGKSVFLEERFAQGGKNKTIRVEIPYEYVLRVSLAVEEAPSQASGSKTPPQPQKR